MNRLLFIIYIIASLSTKVFSQSAISLEYTSFAYHREIWDQNRDILSAKLDTSAQWLYEPGYQLSFEHFFYSTIGSFEYRQGVFYDAALHLSTFLSPTIKWRLLHAGIHFVYVSFGPIITYRDSWKDMKLYQNREDFFNTKINGYRGQWKVLLSVALRYNIYTTARSDLSLSVMYNGEWKTAQVGLGLRYWINPYVVGDERGCLSCGKEMWKRGRLRKWWKKIWK